MRTSGLVVGARLPSRVGPPARTSLRRAPPTRHLPFAATCNLAVTRDCFFDVEGFDKSLPPYGFEDVDFCWRRAERGYLLEYAHDAAITFTVSNKVRAVGKEYS